MKYTNPTCKVLTLNTKHSILEEVIVPSSEPETGPGGEANQNMQFDDAVDDLFGGKVKY